MAQGKITGIVFTQGTTVTLPAPIGSVSSLHMQRHTVTLEYHPIGVRVTAPHMKEAVVVPYAQVKNILETLEQEEPAVTEKRGPGRPRSTDTASH